MMAAMATCRAGQREYLGGNTYREIDPYTCGCPECNAYCEAEAESEYLAETGASYAYSGFSAHDAMQLARHDLVARKLPTAEQMRVEYRRLRREAGTAPAASHDRYAEEMVALIRHAGALHLDIWDSEQRKRAERIVWRDIETAVAVLGGCECSGHST